MTDVFLSDWVIHKIALFFKDRHPTRFHLVKSGFMKITCTQSGLEVDSVQYQVSIDLNITTTHPEDRQTSILDFFLSCPSAPDVQRRWLLSAPSSTNT